MIWVRLIGGLHDGEVAKVDTDQREIVKRREVPAPLRFNRGTGLAAVSATVETARYTRRVAKAAEGEIVYFASDSLSDLESLQHVLGP